MQLRINKSKTTLYNLLLTFLESLGLKTTSLLNILKTLKKLHPNVHTVLLENPQFFGYSVDVSMGGSVRTQAVTKSECSFGKQAMKIECIGKNVAQKKSGTAENSDASQANVLREVLRKGVRKNHHQNLWTTQMKGFIFSDVIFLKTKVYWIRLIFTINTRTLFFLITIIKKS